MVFGRLTAKFLTLGIILAGMIAHTAQAETYYISTTGSDDNSGTTELDAFRSIIRGINAAARDDTLVLLDGFFNEPVRINVQGLTVRAKNRGKAGLKNVQGEGIFILSNDVTIDGLIIQESSLNGIKIGAANAMIQNCLITGNGWGIEHGSTPDTYSYGGEGILCGASGSNAVMRNNVITGNGEHGIYVSDGADNWVIQQNEIARNGTPDSAYGGNGIQTNCPGKNSCIGGYIAENRVYGNFANGMNLMGMAKSIVTGNIVYGNGETRAKSELSLGANSDENVIAFNTLVANRSGRPALENNLGKKTDIDHNILVTDGSRTAGIPFGYLANRRFDTLDDNCYWPGAGDRKVVWNETNQKKYALGDWRAQSGFDLRTIVGDPMFADQATGDFNLGPDSPCREKGADQGIVPPPSDNDPPPTPTPTSTPTAAPTSTPTLTPTMTPTVTSTPTQTPTPTFTPADGPDGSREATKTPTALPTIGVASPSGISVRRGPRGIVRLAWRAPIDGSGYDFEIYRIATIGRSIRRKFIRATGVARFKDSFLVRPKPSVRSLQYEVVAVRRTGGRSAPAFSKILRIAKAHTVRTASP